MQSKEIGRSDRGTAALPCRLGCHCSVSTLLAINLEQLNLHYRHENPESTPRKWLYVELPRVEYREAWDLQKAIVAARGSGIIGADIVEYNPRRDPQGITAMVAAKFVKEIAGRMISSGLRTDGASYRVTG